ncbi:MAG TPA: MdtA/MuxA family multidrug efflux RND transporter periplasmic adaptor subunit [Chitinivibrionales bacterium]|nr:MdtA/MuxA family multidrug efflux RND transporter periplasmic adaptor subunit [Chitinivibrionales bacterium]
MIRLRKALRLAEAFGVAGLCTLFFCGRQAQQEQTGGHGAWKAGAGGPQQAVPVVASKAYVGDIHVYITGMGSVTPLQTVTVKTRVDGELVQVLFREGQAIRKGDLLAVIDPRPFEAQVTQAVGQLARDRALLANARIDLSRYVDLIKQNAIPEQQLATQQALVQQYEGTVTLDSGILANARVQLSYCRITAPASGKAGLRLVDPGNIVHAADPNGIVVITQLQPISVVFSIPEDNVQRLLAKIRSNGFPEVKAFDRSEKTQLAQGRLVSMDNEIDPSTGTVRCKAEFANQDNQLFPGQFVNAHMLLDVQEKTVIVPQAAVQKGPQGTFVYLVRPDRSVSVQQVAVGPSEGDLTAIDTGVSAGDLAVVEGADRLHEGAKVLMPDTSRAVARAAGASDRKHGRRQEPH